MSEWKEYKLKEIAEPVKEPTELKLLHHFSHFTTFEKVMKHDEAILNLPQAIDELMTLLDKDELHFNSLKKAIGK